MSAVPKSRSTPQLSDRRRHCAQQARKHIEEGAVTENYGANREKVIELLNEALATELVCVLRYRHDYFMARGIHSQAVAAEFLEHSNEELAHADQIAERIVQLGGEPRLRSRRTLERPQPCRIPHRQDTRSEMPSRRTSSPSASRSTATGRWSSTSARAIPRPAACWRRSSRSRRSTPTSWRTSSSADLAASRRRGFEALNCRAARGRAMARPESSPRRCGAIAASEACESAQQLLAAARDAQPRIVGHASPALERPALDAARRWPWICSPFMRLSLVEFRNSSSTSSARAPQHGNFLHARGQYARLNGHALGRGRRECRRHRSRAATSSITSTFTVPEDASAAFGSSAASPGNAAGEAHCEEFLHGPSP